jgi:hypothetical protein
MSKQIRVTMPDGSVWAVPAELVASDRFDYYSKAKGEASGSEYAYTLENNDVLLSWASNNMNWSDVAHAAIQIRPGDVDYQEGWLNGPKRVATVGPKQ